MAGRQGPRRFDAASALVAAADALFRRARDRRRRLSGQVGRPARRPTFDATLSLHDGLLREAGVDAARADEAVRAVRTAVRSMRGAGLIDVEYLGPWCGAGWAWMARAEWLTLHPVPEAAPERPGLERLRESVEETVRLALEEVAGG